MKIQNLSKHLLLAVGAMAITFACQSKKADSNSMTTPMEQSAPCDADDGSCGEEQDDMNADQSDESTSASQAPSEPVAEKVAAPSEAPTAAAPKSEADSSVAVQKEEAVRSEVAKPVTETLSDSSQK